MICEKVTPLNCEKTQFLTLIDIFAFKLHEKPFTKFEFSYN